MAKTHTKFLGHQTFSLRYGWLEKGYAYVQNGSGFGDADAIVKLGVGKNMVDSIKYWCEMTGIVENWSSTEFVGRLRENVNMHGPPIPDGLRNAVKNPTKCIKGHVS